MFKTGITSITFRKKTPEEIISVTKAAGLQAIEWASSAHVHEGDLKLAELVRKMTLNAGLEVSSYGHTTDSARTRT